MNYRELSLDEIVKSTDEVLNQQPTEEECRRIGNWTTSHTYAGDKVSECVGMGTGKQRTFRRRVETQDFSSAKVGDKVWSIQLGACIVTEIDLSQELIACEVGINYCQHQLDGRHESDDKFPSLFWSNPNIIAPEKPKRVVKHECEVSISIMNHSDDSVIVTIPKVIIPTPTKIKAILFYETLE